MMRVTVTGATGLVGRHLVAALQRRGDEVTVLSRDPQKAKRLLGVEAIPWSPEADDAPTEALEGRDAIVHLAGEPIAQRWTDESRERIRSSRQLGTARLVTGLSQTEARPGVLVSASAVGYYGARGEERLDERAWGGTGFLASVCEGWEHVAAAAGRLGMRVVTLRTGVVIHRADGALSRMVPPFKLGLGGPVAGGRQYVSWIAPDDLVSMYLAAVDRPEWSGPVNATAPEPVTNRQLAHALGRVLRRPTLLPIPAFALEALYGEMASVVTTGQRAVPARALELGFDFRYTTIDDALAAALRTEPA
jgi:uncharacterized protein